jgi:hypothetical protein
VSLSAEEVAALSAAVPVAAVQGDRYNAHAMQMCHNNQPK